MTLIIEVSCTSSKETKQFVLEDGQSLEIGRSNEELHLDNDARLSRRHFVIRCSDGQIVIKHLSKTNPTLVASDGSKDFYKVEGTRTETGGCRIIAGSHRFVLMVEKADSVLEQTWSESDQGDFWSDVDGEVDGDSQESSAAVKQPAPENRASPTRRDRQPPPRVKRQHAKTDIFDDDDIPPAKQQPSETIKEPAPKVKKLFFPVTDDFFDD